MTISKSSFKGVEIPDVFPCEHVLQRFSFLIDKYGWNLDHIRTAGREVDILLQYGQFGLRIVHEWATLPRLYFEIHHDSHSSKSPTDIQVNDTLFRHFGMDIGSYPVHEKIANSFFLAGLYQHVRHGSQIESEVRIKIDAYASLVQTHYDGLIEYVLNQHKK